MRLPCLLLSAVTLVSMLVSPAAAATGDYFVDCSAQPGDGSAAQPWNSLAQVNEHRFQSGETVRFKAGTSCTGILEPSGDGGTIGRYGEGAKPVIDGAGAAYAVRLKDVSGWTVRDLHVINPAQQTGQRTGVLVESTTADVKRDITLTGLEVSDVAGWGDKTGTNAAWFALSAGIAVRAAGDAGVFQGVRITENEVHDTGAGGIKIQSDPNGGRLHTGVYIGHNRIREVGGDAIVVHAADAPLIEYNVGTDLGFGRYPFIKGNFAGMWPIHSRDPVFQYNEVGRSRPSTFDSMAWDCDGDIMGTCTYRYNLSYNNAGGFYLNCADCTAFGDTTFKQVVEYNISVDDCRVVWGKKDNSPVVVRHNTFVCTSRPLDIDMGDNATFSDNIFLATAGNLRDSNYTSNTYFGGIPAPATDSRASTADPMLFAPGVLGKDGYRLRTESPALRSASDGSNRGADQRPGLADWDAQPLSEQFNTVAVTSAANPSAGSLTRDGRSYLGTERGTEITVDGLRFRWHPGAFGTPDALRVAGQQAAISGTGTRLGLLGAGVDGDYSGAGTIWYSDGTRQSFQLTLPDWRKAGGVLTATRHNRYAKYNDLAAGAQDGGTSVWAASVPIDPKRAVVAVDLPAGSPLAGPGAVLFDLVIG
ncbi:hypothetical protein D5S17_09690 [Pseudonocardiaceae bacterium YIM PH 21723]|nr:hypothetical protein D5S17_09690 [Pseudonocardiaceae bacterium YIM PH 21723]